MSNQLQNWTKFEIIWLFSFITLGLCTNYLNHETGLSYTTLISGILCVVLAAKANILNYWFGIFNSCAYGYICYTNGLYGEMGLNLFFFLPTGILGILLWRRHSTRQQLTAINSLKTMNLINISILTTVSIIIFGYGLSQIPKQNHAYLDASVTMLSITATLLMLMRYREQWVFYIILNTITIILWILRTHAGSTEGLMMLLMWSAFLINSIYGYINWLKLPQQQKVII